MPDSRSWKYRVVDVHIFINGHQSSLHYLKDVLSSTLEGLMVILLFMQFGPFDKHGIPIENGTKENIFIKEQ